MSVVKVKRIAGDTAVVTWKVNDDSVKKVDVEYREKDGKWKKATSDLDPAMEEYKITGLDADKTYEFRLIVKRQGESEGSAIYYPQKGIILSICLYLH